MGFDNNPRGYVVSTEHRQGIDLLGQQDLTPWKLTAAGICEPTTFEAVGSLAGVRFT